MFCFLTLQAHFADLPLTTHTLELSDNEAMYWGMPVDTPLPYRLYSNDRYQAYEFRHEITSYDDWLARESRIVEDPVIKHELLADYQPTLAPKELWASICLRTKSSRSPAATSGLTKIVSVWLPTVPNLPGTIIWWISGRPGTVDTSST